MQEGMKERQRRERGCITSGDERLDGELSSPGVNRQSPFVPPTQ